MIKSARNTEIQDVDPLAKSKDDGSPNFVVHPQAAAVFLQGFTVVCIENGNQESNARHHLHGSMKWMKRQQRSNCLCEVRLTLKRL